MFRKARRYCNRLDYMSRLSEKLDEVSGDDQGNAIILAWVCSEIELASPLTALLGTWMYRKTLRSRIGTKSLED